MDDYNITLGREGGCAQMIGGSIYTHTGGEAYQKMMKVGQVHICGNYVIIMLLRLSSFQLSSNNIQSVNNQIKRPNVLLFLCAVMYALLCYMLYVYYAVQ